MDVMELKEIIGGRLRLLGLDIGEKTIGLAISDERRVIATPMETIRRKKFTADARKLLEIATAREVGGLVLGLPVNMDGSEGPKCQSVRQFAANLGELTDLPMAFWDERLSTMAVTRTLLEADTSRAKRRQVVDKMAAGFILQGALDRMQAGA
ncbi:MAG: Holliday junction resolvase RuvX [Sphingomonadales bacterium]